MTVKGLTCVDQNTVRQTSHASLEMSDYSGFSVRGRISILKIIEGHQLASMHITTATNISAYSTESVE